MLQNIEYVRGLVEIVDGPPATQIDFSRMEQVVGNTITNNLQAWMSDLAFLGTRFHSDAVPALRPAIEGIGDLQRLKELQLAAYNAQSVEAFTQTLYE